MSDQGRLDPVEPFVPLRKVRGRDLIVRLVLGPALWLAALVVVAIVLRKSSAIELGVLIASAALAVSVVVLLFLRAARNRERRRFADAR